MKGEIHEFLRLVWHFLNLEINAGTHTEAREKEKETERNSHRDRHSSKKRKIQQICIE